MRRESEGGLGRAFQTLDQKALVIRALSLGSKEGTSVVVARRWEMQARELGSLSLRRVMG